MLISRSRREPVLVMKAAEDGRGFNLCTGRQSMPMGLQRN
jgi:hypothetical protein